MLSTLSTFILAFWGLVLPHRAEGIEVIETVHHPYDWSVITSHMRAAYDVVVDRVGDPPPWMLLWKGDETLVLDEPAWIQHEVVPRERTTQIAARYGVRVKELRSWNRLSRYSRPKAGTVLRVHARRIPVSRQRLERLVRVGDTWDSLAADYRVEVRDLKAYNKDIEKVDGNPSAGQKIVIWFDPGAPWTVGRTLGDFEPVQVDIDDSAKSWGWPNRGRLRHALQVPDLDLYERRNPDVLWGSSHAIRTLVTAFADFRYETGHQGTIILNSMSRRSGRRFWPHVSHQSGRDIDIQLPLLSGVPSTHGPNSDEVDWPATWGLVKALLDTEEIVFIFLDKRLQRRLYEAARAMGVSREELISVLEWPAGKRRGSIIRHSRGHDDHIHVRFTCGPNEPHCHGIG